MQTTTSIPEKPTGNPDNPPYLSLKHRTEVAVDSAVPDAVVDSRGYRTVGRDEALALGFAPYQARAGLLVPLYMPAGEVWYQLKPDKPRTSKDGKAIKYETAAGRYPGLDINPLLSEAVGDASVPLVVTEGAKTGDSITGAMGGEAATVVLTGVWNWIAERRKDDKGKKRGYIQLHSDWKDIPLDGRRVTLLFDNDWQHKPNVAQAMNALADRLEQSGAHVYIASLPDNERKIGADDYIAAGYDIRQVLGSAGHWHPRMLVRYIAKAKPQALRDGVAKIENVMRGDTWNNKAGQTDHDVLTGLLYAALLSGRRTGEGYILVSKPTRDLQRLARIGCRKTLSKSIARLHERGYVAKTTGNRQKGIPNGYRLGLPQRVHMGVATPPVNRGEKMNNSTPYGGVATPFSEPVTPLPRTSGHDPRIMSSDGVAALYQTAPARLDRFVTQKGGKVVFRPGTPEHKGLGKYAGRIVAALADYPRPMRIADIARNLDVDPKNLRRRALSALQDAGVVGMDAPGKGARVWLAKGWRSAWREATSMDTAKGRRQSAAAGRERASYVAHRNTQADPTPELAGAQHVAASLQRYKDAAELERLKVEDHRRERVERINAAIKAGLPPVDDHVLTFAGFNAARSSLLYRTYTHAGVCSLWADGTAEPGSTAYGCAEVAAAYAAADLGLDVVRAGERLYLHLPHTWTEEQEFFRLVDAYAPQDM